MGENFKIFQFLPSSYHIFLFLCDITDENGQKKYQKAQFLKSSAQKWRKLIQDVALIDLPSLSIRLLLA